MSTRNFMNIKDHGHSLIFYPRSLIFNIFKFNFFSLETARPIETKFHVGSPWDGGMKVNTKALCQMTKMAAMPIYVKTFETLLLWNLKRRTDLKIWYAALVTRVLQNFKIYSVNPQKMNGFQKYQYSCRLLWALRGFRRLSMFTDNLSAYGLCHLTTPKSLSTRSHFIATVLQNTKILT